MFVLTARGRFSKTDFSGHHISRLVIRKQLHQRKWFSPLGLPRVLLCAGRIPSPTNREWRRRLTPATFQVQCRSEGRGSVVVSISYTASTSRNIHTAIKHTFTQKTWKREEPKPNQTFRRSKSKFKGIALFCELHATVLYGNRRLRACLLKCCRQRQSGNIRSLWL